MKEQGIPVWGEIELAYHFAKGRVIAITGTNGKTTTTSLVGQIMQEYFPSVYIVGNIGNPYTDAASDMTENTVSVAEISSFQLETIEDFHPQVSAHTGGFRGGCGDQQLPAGDGMQLRTEGFRYFEYHTGSPEPSSYDGELCGGEGSRDTEPDEG